MKQIIAMYILLIAGLSQGVALDRLVLEVNGESYSQRHLMVLCNVKSAWLAERAQEVRLVTRGSWTGCLEQSSHDLVVLHESKRLRSFQPDTNTTQAALSKVQALAQGNILLADFLKVYGVEPYELRQVLLNLATIDRYVAAKSKRSEGQALKQIFHRSPWFQKLKIRSHLRSYQKAEQYLNIHPLVFASPK